MEQSPSQHPPSLSPAFDSVQAEYWCYQCDKIVSVETLADQSDIVCHECNSGFVESISSIEVSTSPDHFEDCQFTQFPGLLAQASIGEDGDEDEDDFEEEDDDEIEDDGEIGDGNEEAGEIEDEMEDGGEIDDENEENIEFYDENVGRMTQTVQLRDLPAPLQRNILHRLLAMLSASELDAMISEDYENEAESEDVDGRRGAPPAAESAVSALKTFDVEVEKDIIPCAVCKELVSVGQVAKELGCGHGYHEECILPWLGLRNTCPMCRFELPTDDSDYEEYRKEKSIGSSASGNNPGLE